MHKIPSQNPVLSDPALPDILWRVSPTPQPYPAAIAEMEAYSQEIAQGHAPERIWLLEHEACYTAGTSAQSQDLLLKNTLPVYATGRGGQYTYHGPGQRIIYAQLNLAQRGRDVRAYVAALQQWGQRALARLGCNSVIRCERVGLWVPRDAETDDKIAACGVRISRWVTLHGMAINVHPDLAHYAGIIPCGVRQHGITSLEKLSVKLGIKADMAALDAALLAESAAFIKTISAQTVASGSSCEL